MKLTGRDKRLIPIVVVVALSLPLLVFYPYWQAEGRREPFAWQTATEFLSLSLSPTPSEAQTPPPATGEVQLVPFSWSERAHTAWHELKTSEPVVAIIRQDINAQTGAISPDGQYIATGGTTIRDVAISSVAEKRIVYKLAMPSGSIHSVAFSSDGRYLATGRGFMATFSHDESVNIWDMKSGRLLRNLAGPAGPGTHYNNATSLAFSPDSRYLAVSYAPQQGNTTYLFDVENGRRVRAMQSSRPAFGSIVFINGGKLLGYMGYNFQFDVFDVQTGERVQNISDPALYAASPDGRFLAKATSKDNSLRIVERLTGREVRVLGTAKGYHRVLAYSPDGKYLAASSDDGLRIWDVTVGRLVATLTAQPDHVSHWIGFDQAGRYFAAVCGWYVVVWDFLKLTSAGNAN